MSCLFFANFLFLLGKQSSAAEGGYACASKVIIEYLKNKARSFIFATSQTPATLAAALRATEVLEEEPQRAQKLQHNVEFFLNALHAEGVEAYSPTAIIPIIIGDEKSALQVADELLANGVLVTTAKQKIRLLPALNIPMEQLKSAVQIIKRCAAE